MLTARLWSGFSSLREVFYLVWTEASRFVKARLTAVLLLVVTASVLTALGPVALKLVVDGFTGPEPNDECSAPSVSASSLT